DQDPSIAIERGTVAGLAPPPAAPPAVLPLPAPPMTPPRPSAKLLSAVLGAPRARPEEPTIGGVLDALDDDFQNEASTVARPRDSRPAVVAPPRPVLPSAPAEPSR